MKTYKLIQKYPSLPNDWEVGMEVGQGDRGVQGGFSPCNAKYSDFKRIPLDEVINNPNYWEELKQKEFQILSVRLKTSGFIIDSPLFRLVSNDNFKSHIIQSVKRVSDSKVFTIGDIVVRHKDDNCHTPNTTPRIISSFYIGEEGELRFNSENGDVGFMLELFSHAKEPLFTTKDGKDIFSMDEYWWVDLDEPIKYRVVVGPSKIKSGSLPKSTLTFSSHKAAEKYLLLNNPCLTGQDVIDYIESKEGPLNGIDPDFITLVRHKIKF